MKLNGPLTVGPLALLSSWVLRCWLGSLDYRFIVTEAQGVLQPDRQTLFLFWHENLLFPVTTHANQGFGFLSSRHRDGALMMRTLQMLGMTGVSGSSSRGGALALRQLLRQGKIRHIALTPDGPRGPRRVMKPGAVYLASRSEMPLVPLGYAADKAKRVGSWDRMALPFPGATCYCVSGRPLTIPSAATMQELEQYQAQAQAEMDRVQNLADAIAEGKMRCPAWLPVSRLPKLARKTASDARRVFPSRST